MIVAMPERHFQDISAPEMSLGMTLPHFGGTFPADKPKGTDSAVAEGEHDSSLVNDQAAKRAEGLVTDQPQPLRSLSDAQWKIVHLCDVPRSMADLMAELGVTHRTFFRRTHLDPLVKGGVLRLTHPDQPQHPSQAYVLTEAGVELKARRVSERKDDEG